MLNVLAIQGRLCAEPELRQTQTGKAVTTFRIACDRGRKDANGSSIADFFDVTAWEQSAEFVCKYFSKGDMILVQGQLVSRKYQDKNGNNRTDVEILARNLNFCGGGKTTRPDAESATQSVATANTAQYSAGSNDDFIAIDDNEDIPF